MLLLCRAGLVSVLVKGKLSWRHLAADCLTATTWQPHSTQHRTALLCTYYLAAARWYCWIDNNTFNIYIHTISPKYLVWNASWYHCIHLLLCPCKVGWYAGMLLCTTARVTRPHLPSQPCTPRHPYSHHPSFLCKYFHEYLANILKLCRYAVRYSPTLDDYVLFSVAALKTSLISATLSHCCVPPT